MMGILKRRFSELDEGPCYSSSSSPASSALSPASSGWDSDTENLDVTPPSSPAPAALPLRSILKRPKLAEVQNRVCFVQVTVYSFPRCQGFTSVPSRGGATLGMMRRHSDVQTFTIAEHALEQRHRRREQLRQRQRQDKFQEIKHKLISSGAINEKEVETLTIDQVPMEETDININSVELEGGGFLQTYSSKQRQAILLAAGVKRIDKEEKRQLHALRLSRETCGCDCQGFCEPESCACSLAGIKCQVDRFNFPCGCSQDGCGNTRGRVEFDSRRVRTHHFHTIMRLELERRLKHETPFSKDQSKVQKSCGKTRPSQSTQNDICPSGFPLEEDNNYPVTIPSVSSFSLSPEQPVVEENSCSSDMTDSSCSSLDAVSLLEHLSSLSENNLGSSHNLNICDNNTLPGRNTNESLSQNSNTSTDFTICSNDNTFIDILSLSPQFNCLDENSLEDFPNTPSPSGDYYMDLSLSSDSDLEFFDSDYTSGLPHSSFKSQRLSDSLDHLQLFSSDSLPQDESSTYLLETLIGLTD
ncbi:cysteine/serine-rich nuclear protein 3-like [Eucyclogobius newberryi]|uniref:cysteine/serine-rich nuclear protein 3-like n=1 Tax=Eucyclogobius newberryi TaxID=166745 RepID=UPI003B5CD166